MRNLLPVLFCFLSLFTRGQHCPFDGYSTLVIQVQNLPAGEALPKFRLVEVAGSYTDSCSFEAGKIDVPFRSEAQVLADCRSKNSGMMSRHLPGWLKSRGDFIKGNMAVFLTMAGVDCMVKTGDDYRYIKRVFNIEYEYHGKKYSMSASANSIFKMCSGAGSWKRILPVVIDLGQG